MNPKPLPNPQNSKIAVVVVAAGRGERASQADGPKQYRRIGGKAVIWHTLKAFLDHPQIDPITVVAIHADDAELFAAAAGEFASRVTTVVGGATRQDSTRLALIAASTGSRP